MAKTTKIHQKTQNLSLLLRLSDLMWILLLLWLLYLIRGLASYQHYFLVSVIVALAFLGIAELMGLYKFLSLTAIKNGLIILWKIWLLVIALLILFQYILKISAEFSRFVMLSWFIIPLTLSIWHLFFKTIVIKYYDKLENNHCKAVVVGINSYAVQFVEEVIYKNKSSIDFQGFCDERIEKPVFNENQHTYPVLGNTEKMLELAKLGKIDLVYLAISLSEEERLKNLIFELSDTTVSVHVILPDIFNDMLHSRIVKQNKFLAISVYETPLGGIINDWLKRTEDIILGSVTIIIITLPMLFIALMIKVTSRGPILFKQERYGLNGDIIEVWKFRSMNVCENGNIAKQAVKNDARITWFGRFLRRSSLDELPQFIQVLRGDMSIVGPRPHPIILNEQHRERIPGYMLRHKVKPGITGWAQVNGWRGETDTLEKMQRRVEFDLEYIRNWSLWFDLKIILLTVFKGVFHKNAY
jgi:putative colanic acid biosynthesis UDP-glucose lipid carrier transferase